MLLPDKLDDKALITGASGFVGSRLRDALLDAGADVVAIRRSSSPEPKRGRSVVGDYADVDGLSAGIDIYVLLNVKVEIPVQSINMSKGMLH